MYMFHRLFLSCSRSFYLQRNIKDAIQATEGQRERSILC